MFLPCVDQLLFREVQNAFMAKLVKHCALTNVNSDRGFESWPGYEVKPPDCHSSLEAHGHWFPATGRIFGRRADVAHPRPGSFGPHGRRIDFCEDAAFCQKNKNAAPTHTHTIIDRQVIQVVWVIENEFC